MILLTGATGFVGRHVTRALAAQGHPLRVLVRDRSRLDEAPGAPIDAVEIDDVFALTTEHWREHLAGIDAVVHLAWYAEPGQYLESPRNLACLNGTLTLARACLEAGVGRFVGIGSCAEYALGDAPLDHDAPLDPTTLYASCKVAAFHILRSLFARSDVTLAWCRLFYLHGEGEDARRLVPYLRARLEAGRVAELSAGTQVRDFIDVADAARMIAAVTVGKAEGAFNVCSGEPTTVRELAERIAAEYGRPDLLAFGARPDNAFDPPRVVGVPAGRTRP